MESGAGIPATIAAVDFHDGQRSRTIAGGVIDLDFCSIVCHVGSSPQEEPLVHKRVVCPSCQGDQVVKRGKTDPGKQRYRCHNPECDHPSFLLDPAYTGRLPEIEQQVIEMTLNGSGIRDTARV